MFICSVVHSHLMACCSLQEFVQCPEELYLRHCVSVTVQRLLLVLKSSGCLLYCASWYAQHLLSPSPDLPAGTKEALQLPSIKTETRAPAYLKKLSRQKTGTMKFALMHHLFPFYLYFVAIFYLFMMCLVE